MTTDIQLLSVEDALAAARKVVAGGRREATTAPLSAAVSICILVEQLHETALLATRCVEKSSTKTDRALLRDRLIGLGLLPNLVPEN